MRAAGQRATWWRTAARPSAHSPAEWAAIASIFILAVTENAAVAVSQFHGEDEPTQATAVARIVHALLHFNGVAAIARIGEVLTSAENPPLRYLLSLPGWLIAPDTEWGLRAGAVIGSMVVVVLVVKLGSDIGGPVVGYASGLLVAASGVFAWLSLAFGWSVIVVALLAVVRSLRVASLDLGAAAERKRARRLTSWTAVAVLVNVGAILFFAALVLVYLPANRRRIRDLLRAFGPGLAFFGGYYVFFAYVAPWSLTRYWRGRVPSGQFSHGEGRVSHAGLNVHSSIENIRGLNAYLLPFASWVILGLAVVYLVRRERRVVVFLAPFLIAWSFVLEGDSQSYFLLGVIPLVPYGVAELVRLIRPAAATAALGAVILVTLGWSLSLFVVPYTERAYPGSVLSAAYATADRSPNIVEPYGPITRDLDRLLAHGGRWSTNAPGALATFYASPDHTLQFDPRFAPGAGRFVRSTDGRCLRFAASPPRDVRVAITSPRLCASEVRRVIAYPGSPLTLGVIRRGVQPK